ncbi:hypothetical protein Dimus_007461 [Dionaea muscipula]
MSMKKAFDQTIRDLKREVNKKVLKVPSIEQKILDATSNEAWGPHGSLLSDIALATRNYHEYQMIMTIIWKRINDTGRNWRHVYKALTVLEYLVANGSERVIEEIKEHAYQISTLSDFQYIDSNGRDQGNNVRRKSQSLVLLVNDKERIQEARQKAASNRDKYSNTSVMGGMYRPSSYGDRYDDDRYEGRYGSRDEERNSYGKEREWGYKDDDRYGRHGDSYSRDGEQHGRDSEERYGRGSYRDDDYPGRSRSFDESQQGSRRSSDRERDHSFDDDDHHSSRGSGNKVEEYLQEARKLERKFSEQNLGAPPSYEEAVGGPRSPAFSERDGDMPTAPAPKPSSPPANNNQSRRTADLGVPNSHPKSEAASFDEFDPRGPVTAAPVSSNAEMDLLGSLSDSWSSNPMAIVPVSSAATASEMDSFETSGSGSTHVAASHVALNPVNQSFEDPFGDSPFRAVPSHDEVPVHSQTTSAVLSSQPTVNNGEQAGQVIQNLEFTDALAGLTFNSSVDQNSQFHQLDQKSMSHELPSEDILAGILPPMQATFVAPTNHPTPQTSFLQTSQPSPQTGFLAPNQPSPPNANGISYIPQWGPTLTALPSAPQSITASTPLHGGVSFPQQSASAGGVASNVSVQLSSGVVNHQNNNFLSVLPQAARPMSLSLHQGPSSSTGSLASVSEPRFETKSTVWADTLSRGLVNLNISGPKTNPMADIGVDFEALNRKEKRMEKPTMAPATSTAAMGRAMGSGSGVGRVGAGALRPPLNPVMGQGMGMGIGMGPNMGHGYGGVNQQMGYGVGMGPMGGGLGANMGMGMNMGMAQGAQIQPMNTLPPGSNLNGYNPSHGAGYAQQPYGGGYN